MNKKLLLSFSLFSSFISADEAKTQPSQILAAQRQVAPKKLATSSQVDTIVLGRDTSINVLKRPLTVEDVDHVFKQELRRPKLRIAASVLFVEYCLASMGMPLITGCARLICAGKVVRHIAIMQFYKRAGIAEMVVKEVQKRENS